MTNKTKSYRDALRDAEDLAIICRTYSTDPDEQQASDDFQRDLKEWVKARRAKRKAKP